MWKFLWDCTESYGMDFFDSGLVRSCPHVQPHSSGYLHYLMEQGSLSELEGSYNQNPGSSSQSTYSDSLRYNHNFNNVGHSEAKSGFQPVRDQEVADKCVKVPPCDHETPYRTIDGACNNFNFPMWGKTGTALVRLLQAKYIDGKNKVAKSKNGRELPNARDLRTRCFPNKEIPDDLNTLLIMQWGQAVSHDVGHIVQQNSNQGGLDCCASRPAMTLPRACMQIWVPNNDSFYSQHNVKCLNFVRATTTDNIGCKLTPQQQIATVTHFVDASIVYGSEEKTAKSLRTFVGGKLKGQSTDNEEYPPNTNNPIQDCDYDDNQKNNVSCYLAGDDRVNQNTGITVLQILLFRLHNKLATDLSKVNPHWDDEKLYQESRRILIAIFQKITYHEYLEKIIGKDMMSKFGFRDGIDNDGLLMNAYDQNLNPTTLNEFTSCAYRAFHSMVPGNMVLFDENQKIIDTLKLEDFFFRPDCIRKYGMDPHLRGLAWQKSLIMDSHHSSSISNLLFKSSKPWGTDLISIDITRGRDHGLPSYNSMREACGHPRATDFSHFRDLMSDEAVSKLRSSYQHVDDVELYVAGQLETLAPGALLGTTFQCIVVEQFKRWREGDRFFFTFGGQAGSFSVEQLTEIRKVTLASVICNNGDNINSMQPDVFRTISQTNQVKPCNSYPKMDFSPWKEK